MNNAVKTYECAGDILLGGYGVLYKGKGNYWERQYTGLPDHNQIGFNFKFYPIDGWDGDTDTFQISFDQIILDGIPIKARNSSVDIFERCGADYRVDYPPFIVQISVPHTEPTLTVRVTNFLNNNPTEESFGFREIIMEFMNVPIPYQDLCGVSETALPSKWCLCQDHQFQDPPKSGTCTDCDSSCATCSAAGPDKCLSCPSGFYLKEKACHPCVSPCVTCTGSTNGKCLSCISGRYLTGKTCYTTCNAPLQVSVDQGIIYCGLECATSVTLWDGTCAATCDSPLVSETVNNLPTCKFPCAANDFAYWDGTCGSVCPSPLIKRYVNGRKICEYPCTGPDVVYWYGECVAQCLPPFQLESHSNYDVCVSSCTGNLFLYPNGSCLSNCPKPYSSYVEKTTYVCDYSCDPGSYYSMESKSCVSPCPSGYYEYSQDRVCLACQDPLCSQCSAAGTTCNLCKDGAILDFDGVCKQCESLKTRYIKPTGSNSHEYLVTLIPDSCDLSIAMVQSQLLPTLQASKNFPPFSLQSSYISPHTYKVQVTFDDSVLKAANLDITLSYLSGSLAVPKTIAPSDLAKSLEEAAPAVTTTIATTMGTSFSGSLLMGASTAMWSMLSFQQFIGYFIYLNVDYPPQLETFLSFFSFTDWNFLPNPIASLTEDWKEDLSLDESSLEGESRYQLPPKFVKYEVSPFFIDNGGSLISLNMMMLVAPFLLHQLRRIRILNLDRFLWKVATGLRWNGIFRAFLENSIPMLFATLIQLKKSSFDNIYTAISTFLAILSFLYLTMMLHFVWDVLQTQTKRRLELPLVKVTCGTLYEGLKLRDSLAKYYHLLIMLRGFLLVFLVVFLDIQPMLQVVPLILYNICILWYLFRKSVFEDSKMNIINKIKESLIVVGEILILCLCIEKKSNGYYQVLGWLALCTFTLATLVELGYLVIIQVIDLIRWIKKLIKYLFSKKEVKKMIEEKIEARVHRKYPRIKVRIQRDRQRNIDFKAQLARLASEFTPLEQTSVG